MVHDKKEETSMKLRDLLLSNDSIRINWTIKALITVPIENPGLESLGRKEFIPDKLGNKLMTQQARMEAIKVTEELDRETRDVEVGLLVDNGKVLVGLFLVLVVNANKLFIVSICEIIHDFQTTGKITTRAFMAIENGIHVITHFSTIILITC